MMHDVVGSDVSNGEGDRVAAMIPLGFLAIVRSELLKMKAVRSSYVLPLAAIILMWVTAAGFAITQASTEPGELIQDNFASIPASGSLVAGILMAAAAVTMSVSEFRTGTINTSLLAVPSRRLLFGGKAVVTTIVGVVAGCLSTFGGLAIAALVLGAEGRGLHLGNTTLWVNVFGGVAIFVALSWIGFALAMVTRSTMGSMMLVFSGVFGPSILEAVAIGLDWQWLRQLARLLPGLLLNTATTTIELPSANLTHIVSPFVAGVLLLCWGAAFVAAAMWHFIKR